MQLIKCKVELKLRWMKHCVFSAAGADNTNANDNIFFLSKKQNYMSPAKDNKKLSKLLSRGFERSVYWN